MVVTLEDFLSQEKHLECPPCGHLPQDLAQPAEKGGKFDLARKC